MGKKKDLGQGLFSIHQLLIEWRPHLNASFAVRKGCFAVRKGWGLSELNDWRKPEYFTREKPDPVLTFDINMHG